MFMTMSKRTGFKVERHSIPDSGGGCGKGPVRQDVIVVSAFLS